MRRIRNRHTQREAVLYGSVDCGGSGSGRTGLDVGTPEKTQRIVDSAVGG